MKLMITLLLFVAFAIGAYLRRKDQRRTYRAVADDLGLEVDGHEFSGTLGGYEIETRQVRQRQSRYSKVGAKVLEAKLRTPPSDLTLDRESITSTVARKAGFRDVEVGAPEFDDVFRIECQHEAETLNWLRNEGRRATLLQLDRLVDALEIHDGWLRIVVPTDPVKAGEVRQLLEWFVAIARRLDEPPASASPLPPLEARLRKRRSKWRPLVVVSLALLPLMLFGGYLAYVLLSLGAFEEREPRDEIGVWTDGQGMSVPAKEEFLRCVETTPKTPDVDFSDCESSALDVNLAFEDVRDAYVTMRTLQARKAARVELDRTAAEETLQTIVRETEGTVGHDKLVRSLTPHYWNLGLHDRYRELLATESGPRRDPLPAVASLRLLHTGSVGPSVARQALPGYVAAMNCLHDGAAFGRRSGELSTACGARMRYKWRVGAETRLLVPPGEVLGALDANPQATVKILVQVTAGRLDPELELAWYVYGQSDLAEGLDRASADPADLASRLDPIECPTPWMPADAFGEPEKLLAAADDAGPLADRLRLYAARQSVLFREHDEAREALDTISSDGIETICAAQLESTMGTPAGALKRLELVSGSHGGLHALVRAQAHALAGEWERAYDHGHEALADMDRLEQRDHAVLVVIAAAARLGRDDGLDEILGPVPAVSELRDDSVDVTRWLSHASHDGRSKESHRWVAPDSLPVSVGSEPMQFIAAQELAAGEDAELWLDILMPEQFEASGVALGRRIAAEVRGDEEAANSWGRLERQHLKRVTDPAKARVYRLARRYDVR